LILDHPLCISPEAILIDGRMRHFVYPPCFVAGCTPMGIHAFGTRTTETLSSQHQIPMTMSQTAKGGNFPVRYEDEILFPGRKVLSHGVNFGILVQEMRLKNYSYKRNKNVVLRFRTHYALLPTTR
jgi:hypothetical protein